MFGAKLALGIAIVCALIGVRLLIAGARHREGEVVGPWNLARLARVLVTLLLFGATSWTMWHFAQKRLRDESLQEHHP